MPGPLFHDQTDKNIKLIFFSPGASGNFLSRLLNIHPNIECWKPGSEDMPINPLQRFNILSYPFKFNGDDTWTKDWRNWINFEAKLLPVKYPTIGCEHQSWTGEIVNRVWCRITVSDREEWCWMVGNCHWKNTWFSATMLKSSMVGEQDNVVPLRDFWSWDTLFPHLNVLISDLGFENTDEVLNLQEKLFYSWKETWPPKSFIKDAVNWMRGPDWLDKKL
jgi:hypothetical protein